MTTTNQEIGMVGLGVMGCNLLLNIADHGFSAAGYDKDTAKVKTLQQRAEQRNIVALDTAEKFIASLRRPRAIILLVPAGPAVDAVIHDLLPHLEKGDLIIDAGNSYFKDTNLRIRTLNDQGFQFLGVGVSGGEEGARHGPSIMPGGSKEAYERVRPIFEAAAAKADGATCVTYLGNTSAGHFVKMVHNGIEYGVMQLIAEAYDLMKRGLGMNDDELHNTFTAWNEGELNGYLIEITAAIFAKADNQPDGGKLVDKILAVAKQNGTGMWTSQSGMELQVPTPTIDAAVTIRDLSVLTQQRADASKLFPRSVAQSKGDRKAIVEQIRSGLYASLILTYAQGMAVLGAASTKYDYKLDLEAVARIWRGGCIIRSTLLEDIRNAFRGKSDLPNLLLDPGLAKKIMAHQENLRKTATFAAELGVAAPALMSSLAYLDAFRSAWLPANLIQAQRDFFGSHTYERIDTKGTFHTQWEKA
jgi:6-phosphogluconate dehydrogenase